MTALIRAATTSDVPSIHSLLRDYADDGRLLARSSDEINERLRGFLVAETDGEVCGCGSLEIFTRELGEVRSLAVLPSRHGQGLGQQMVDGIEQMARELGLTRMIALTYVPGFFRKLGYQIVAMESLPEKVFGVCVTCPKFDHCDEIAMQKSLTDA